ncbi:hypothetical protein OIU79_029320 [Salix purpurea]|uniref:Uncharacterized protein n=1 Tax=Salix purpurea TaxID=77065 RepID=A0A9Q0ZV87_SALPP|nr:hypothetical protein OIU79_029320 [Salix purpurea]
MVISDAEKRIPVMEMLQSGKVTGSISTKGKWRIFDHKKMSRKRCGSLRGQGWKYGSGFVDGIFPVLSPVAHQILNFG